MNLVSGRRRIRLWPSSQAFPWFWFFAAAIAIPAAR